MDLGRTRVSNGWETLQRTRAVLATMSTELRQLYVAKARLFSITDGQIVSAGIRGLLT
jgi:hypothetical protein